jgi:hypothetical protein
MPAVTPITHAGRKKTLNAFAKSSMISNTMGQKLSIFISHSSADNDVALMIHKQLKELGYAPWIALTDVPPGANYARTIFEALEKSSAFIVVLTESAIKSVHVMREVDVAISQKIPLFPLNMSGQESVQPLLSKEWKYWLSIVQTLNASDVPAAINSLIEAFSQRGLAIDLDAHRSKSKQSVEANKELEAKVLQDQTSREANHSAQRLEPESNWREEIKHLEHEKLKAAESQRRVEAAAPNLGKASKVIDWLKQLTQLLSNMIIEGQSHNVNFDYENFKSSFDANFKVELEGIKDLTRVELYWIGLYTLDIYRILVKNTYLVGERVERAKQFLDLSYSFNYANAMLDFGEWSFAKNGTEFGKKYFCSDENRKKFFISTKEYAQLSSNGSEESEIQSYKNLIDEWKWLEIFVQLADHKIRPDKLNTIFLEIDQLLMKSTIDGRIEARLTDQMRVQFKFLAAQVLFRLERHTAARNYLREIIQDSEEYRNLKNRLHFLLDLAENTEVKDFIAKCLKAGEV